MKIRVHAIHPEEPDLFKKIISNYLTDMETSRLLSDGFVEGTVADGMLEGLHNCPAVSCVEHIKETKTRRGWLSWLRW